MAYSCSLLMPSAATITCARHRFEYEDGEAVLYCYELQVARAAQQRGLGRAMMELLEQIVRVCVRVSLRVWGIEGPGRALLLCCAVLCTTDVGPPRWS